MSRFGVFTINGVEYDLDDLTLDEAEEVEERAGGPLGDLNYGSAKTMKAITRVLLQRTNPEVTDEEVGKVKLISFMPAEEEMPALPPDAPAAEGSQTSLSGSEPDDSGAPPSVVSIAG